jgi:hypothetical protein
MLAVVSSAMMAQSPLPQISSLSGDENWDAGFGLPGVNGEVKAIAVSGDDIYIGGDFTRAGSLFAGRIARWNRKTHRWSALGSGTDGTVMTIVVSGENVYVGGSFDLAGGETAHSLAIYNSVTGNWSAWGGGTSGGYVAAIAISGNEAYAGGSFSAIGTTLANNIAHWDGTRWYRMDAGTNSSVDALALDGNDLYVGGTFTTAGPIDAAHLARWDGSKWWGVGRGTDGPVHTLALGGRDLYIGGSFGTADSIRTNNIARLTIPTASWSTLDSGVYSIGQGDEVNAIAIEGNGIYVGGRFRIAGDNVNIVRHVAHWNGSSWDALQPAGESVGRGVTANNNRDAAVDALAIVDSDIYIGGLFDNAYMSVMPPNIHDDGTTLGYSTFNIVRWSRTNRVWRSFGDAPNDRGVSIAIAGEDVYIGGRFTSSGGVDAMNIARWNSTTRTWSALGSGLGGVQTTVLAIAAAGSDIYAAAYDQQRSQSFVARWNASTGEWSLIGDTLRSLEIFDIAAGGNDLYIGGWGYGDLIAGIFRWDGSRWSTVGGGVRGRVYAIAIDGDDLYAGGAFTSAGGVAADNIARWNGSTGTWSPLGTGVDGPVDAIASIDGRIYAGGAFASAGGIESRSIAQWDGAHSTWTPLGSGIVGTVHAIAGGNGDIYAGGDFPTAGDESMLNIARWDGETWNALGNGTDGAVLGLDADARQVVAVGDFILAGNHSSYRVARWSDAAASVAAASARSTSLALRSAPNPFPARTTIRFSLPAAGSRVHAPSPVRLRIYDPLGRPIATLLDGTMTPGEKSIDWDAGELADGLYLCRLEWEGISATAKIVVRK